MSELKYYDGNLNPIQKRCLPVSAPHLPDLVLEPRHLCPGVLDAREHVGQQREQQRNILGHQLRNHRLAHALDQDLGSKFSINNSLQQCGSEISVFSIYSNLKYLNPSCLHLLLWQVLCDLSLVDGVVVVLELLADALDAVALHVARGDQHALERAQAEVVVGLVRQLLVTQSAGGDGVICEYSIFLRSLQ